MHESLQELVNKMERKMRSGNSVPVRDVHIKTSELRTVLDTLYWYGAVVREENSHD